MIECETKIDGKIQKEILKTNIIMSLIFLIVGAIGSIAYLVLTTIFSNIWLNLLLIFAFVFGFGLIFFISLNKTIKIADQESFTNKYQFYEDELVITSLKNGEIISTATTKYSQFIKIRENQNFILIYPSKNATYPIVKNNISQQDLNDIRKILKITNN